MPPRSRSVAGAVAETSFDPNVPVDPSQVATAEADHTQVSTETSDQSPQDVPGFQSANEIKQTLKTLIGRREVDPLQKFEKPDEGRMTEAAKSRLAKAVGSAAELRELQARADAARKECDRKAADLRSQCDAEIERVRREYAQRIAEVGVPAKELGEAVVMMRSAREQVLASAPPWLKIQIRDRSRAINEAHHQSTTCMQDEVNKMRKFVHPPDIEAGLIDYKSWPRPHEAFASYVLRTFSRGNPFLPDHSNPSHDDVMTHLRRLHAEWSAKLPELEHRYASNVAAKQRDIDLAENEAIQVCIESL